MRTILGFLAAPIVPIFFIFLVQVFTIGYSEALTLLLTLTSIGYAIAIIFGIPMHVALKYKKIFTMQAYIYFGAILGLIPYAILFVPTYFSSVNEGHFFLLFKNTVGFSLLGAGCGMVSSFVFWFFVVRDSAQLEKSKINF